MIKALMAALLLAAVACDSPTVDTSADASTVVGSGGVTTTVSPNMPELHLAGMHASATSLDAEAAAEDAIQPDLLGTMLANLGFRGARERLYTGRHGIFARVAVRKWVFGDAGGASAFLTWLRDRPRQLIGDAEPLDTALPSHISLVEHEPSGCCHEEVPIYLASWQRGHIVWTIRASGPRIHTPPVLALITSVEQEA